MRSSSRALDIAEPSLECRGVTRRMASGNSILTVLDAVNLTITAREFVAIVGPSGSGKSTLLGLLAGFDRCSKGSVRIAGTALETLDEDALSRLRRELLGFVFQDFQLLDNLSARENVALPLELLAIGDTLYVGEARLRVLLVFGHRMITHARGA